MGRMGKTHTGNFDTASDRGNWERAGKAGKVTGTQGFHLLLLASLQPTCPCPIGWEEDRL